MNRKKVFVFICIGIATVTDCFVKGSKGLFDLNDGITPIRKGKSIAICAELCYTAYESYCTILFYEHGENGRSAAFFVYYS